MEHSIRKIWKDPATGKKAAAPTPSAILKAVWANLFKFMSRFTRVSVCAGLDNFTNCCVVVFISFIPAVAPGPFWQPGLPGQLGIPC